MLNKETIPQFAVISGVAADKISPEGVVTAVTSEVVSNYIILGYTFGAWVTIALGISAFLMLIFNLHKLVYKVYSLYKNIRLFFAPDTDAKTDKII